MADGRVNVSDGSQLAGTATSDLDAVLECFLFVSPEPVTPSLVAAVLEIDERAGRDARCRPGSDAGPARRRGARREHRRRGRIGRRRDRAGLSRRHHASRRSLHGLATLQVLFHPGTTM